jgi:hypothetical protein
VHIICFEDHLFLSFFINLKVPEAVRCALYPTASNFLLIEMHFQRRNFLPQRCRQEELNSRLPCTSN